MRIVALNIYLSKLCGKSGMTAVVRPIGVNYLYLALRRVALLALEIVAHKNQVLFAHCKADLLVIIAYIFVRHIYKAVNRRYGEILRHLLRQGVGNLHTSLSALNGIDDILAYSLKFALDYALESIEFGTFDKRTLRHRKQLHALHRAVCSLVILSGKIFDDKQLIPVKLWHLLIQVVYGSFAENRRLCACINALVKIFDIISDKFACVLNGNAKHVLYIGRGLFCRYVVALFFLYENSLYHLFFLLL